MHVYWTVRRNTYSPGLLTSTLYIVIFYLLIRYGLGGHLVTGTNFATGTMIAVGALYLGLSRYGIRRGAHWALVAVLASAFAGFGSFFLFLGFGYFEPFHAFVTAVARQLAADLAEEGVVARYLPSRTFRLHTARYMAAPSGAATAISSMAPRIGSPTARKPTFWWSMPRPTRRPARAASPPS